MIFNGPLRCSISQKRLYTISMALLCLSYLIFQLFNNQYSIWSVDDFWFAHRIYEFKNGLPYRDFSPYKTILGYYLLLPTMTLGHDALTPLLYTKNFIAILNTILFAMTGYWLTRFFPKPAVFITLLLLMSANFVLNYSTNIRVDLLAYWLCLFSALLLLDNAFLWAGIVIGAAFLTSQKALWYIAASNIALICYWLLAMRNKKFFAGMVIFNVGLTVTISTYIAIWSWIAGWQIVLHNMFYEAYIMFHLDIYDSTRKFFWEYTLKNNPLLFLLWPCCFITLFVTPKKDELLKKRIFITAYTTVILWCLIPYKQVFPYYMLTALPAFILLYAAFFSWLMHLLRDKSPVAISMIGKEGLWGFIILFIFCLLYTNIIFGLPCIFLLIIGIPLLLGIKITTNKDLTILIATPALIVLITSLLGLIYPLILLIQDLKINSRHYQQSMVQLTETLLKDGSHYLAGIELIYNKNQPIPGMRHLDVPALVYLYHPTPALSQAMLASLYHTPDTSIAKVIHYLDISSVKFYVNNYRMEALPMAIKNYLTTHYTHFWGSIYLYAPMILSGPQKITVKFSGKYFVETASTLDIDHVKIQPHSIIPLSRGQHISLAKKAYRLILQDDTIPLSELHANEKKDTWKRMLG